MLKGFKAVPQLATDIDLSMDGRFYVCRLLGYRRVAAAAIRRLRAVCPEIDGFGADRRNSPARDRPGGQERRTKRRSANGRSKPRRPAGSISPTRSMGRSTSSSTRTASMAGWSSSMRGRTEVSSSIRSSLSTGRRVICVWRACLPSGADPKDHQYRSRTGNVGALAAGAWNLVQTYLSVRGYRGAIPPLLYFVAGKHPSDGQFHPVMLAAALVLSKDPIKFAGVHRTFLRTDGLGKAPLDPEKMTLGDIRGAGVPLANPGPKTAVSEGNGYRSSRRLAFRPWLPLQRGLAGSVAAGRGAGGVQRSQLRPVGLKAAQAAARRWYSEGRKVRIVRPPEGQNFNDIARMTTMMAVMVPRDRTRHCRRCNWEAMSRSPPVSHRC